ncbi:uncharacterized protein SPAPADRAFT_55914 [Spathaspora passalidarum NRRL Y-27907]|uniref:Uncharacterized protein n=1 Tax=Spathaspora passalidarum (strain NRRL Y-27907 / 11-Y1) TaxID=619300 RepID=G3AN86_SPAPN|nr:uncharacterized protein SPAPADRAFT_55914 [Spathaspora passalidarum NRRL Y-27907]EGW32469.1 hypothetical protein SPAPADRAFT_55914 [Spathaspora passalidarum NRRL Y-27907]
MSSIHSLIGELTNLSTESKRRFTETRHACDKAVAALKSYPSWDIQIKDISQPQHKQEITRPVILACKSGNAKLTTISLSIIHKLIMAQLIPIDTLKELLNALLEASHLAIDIQLRILQCLPSFMQSYSEQFTGELLLILLEICSSLTANNKSTVVINTASATLQQLFSNIYDKIKELPEGVAGTHQIKIDNDEIVTVDDLSNEGYLIFQDLCHFIENEKPTYLKESIHIKLLSVLEIVENIIASHTTIFLKHQELAYLLRVKVVPSMLRILNSPLKPFPLVDRTMRIIYVLLSTQLENLEIESEVVLSFLNHLLLDGSGNTAAGEFVEPDWEKVLVLELFKGLFSDFQVMKSIYTKFDYNKDKKNVVLELLTILGTYLSNNSQLLQEEIRPIPKSWSVSSDQQHVYLSKSTSGLKTSILDHLDKSEPPTGIPPTYTIYLIHTILTSFCEGIANFVASLSEGPGAADLEEDVQLINALISRTAKEITGLYHRFIYTIMDEECFHLLIRSMQRFTHTTGLLGLVEIRDDLLLTLSRAIINNIPHKEVGRSPTPETGKQPFGFGFVETISSSLNDANGAVVKEETDISTSSVHSRYFNSRHITCIRALANLAISLGSTLKSSWTIIWVTFQWCDYFINGHDEFFGYIRGKVKMAGPDGKKPDLSNADIVNVQTSMKKLLESIGDYNVDSYYDVVDSLTSLSNREIGEGKQEEEDTDLHTCPYNKSYFLNKLVQVCEINGKKFLIEDNKSWELIQGYFIELGSCRTLHSNVRISITEAFTNVIKTVSHDGFEQQDDEETIHITSEKSLESLGKYLNSLVTLGLAQELLVLNCETDIYLTILTTLHELIDKYDTFYQKSWNKVFHILNLPFTISGNGATADKFRLLVEKSYDTLKLILDEFLSSLPFDQYKLLIDTLGNFVDQKYDLNISFSSVSYFWLISDSLKSRIVMFSTERTKQHIPESVVSDAELVEFITSSPESLDLYTCLDIYLLSSLTKISQVEERAQVKNGSIQTFFQIIDVHGSLLGNCWDLIYEIVLPKLFSMIPKPDEFGKVGDKTVLESYNLMLDGFTSLYNKFMRNKEIEGIVVKWQALIDYLKRLLSSNSVDLKLQVFKSFHDLLVSVYELSGSLTEIRNMVFRLWVEVPVEYDFINIKYQECLVELMKCFPDLYKIIISKLTLDEANTIINMFNKCARYPILPTNQLDDVKPTSLQASVIENLNLIDVKESPAIQSLVIQQLGVMIIYPFGIRSRIESKLTSNKLITDKFKLPTFVALGHVSLEILLEKLNSFEDSQFSVLIQDRGALKCLKSFIEIIDNHAEGVKSREKPAWILANQGIYFIIKQLLAHDSSVQDDEMWKLIIQDIKLCFQSTQENQDVKIEQYKELSELILPNLLARTKNDSTELLSEYVEILYDNSFLYEFNEWEKTVFDQYKNNNSSDELIEQLTNYPFEEVFGTTTPLVKYDNYKSRITCLQELIKFSKPSFSGTTRELQTISQKFLVARASFCSRRFISDQRLLYKCPIPIVQQRELMIILNGLGELRGEHDNKTNQTKLYRLLIKLIPYATRIDGAGYKLTKVLDTLVV